MKRILTFLTLIALGLVVSLRQSDAQQYAWMPVISNEPVTVQSPTAYSTSIGESYATYVGDLAEPDGELEDSCSSKGDCQCPSCQYGSNFIDRAFVGVEFLQWYNKGRNLPPLVTGGDPNAVPIAAAGILPAAPVVFGGDAVGDDLKAGARITGGFWFDDCETTGAIVRAFGTEGDSTPFATQSLGNPILAVPFNDRSAGFFGLENALVLAYATGDLGVNAVGGVDARASNDIWGGDAFLRTNVDKGCDYRIDLLAGYQFARIDDDLELRTNLTRLDIAGTPSFTTSDLFDVSNEFHGGEFGLMGEFFQGPLTLQFMGKIGLGNMNQTATIAGSNTVTAGGPPLTTTGGIFAQDTPPASNIGSFERNVFTWSPEASIKAIYCVSDRLNMTVGYTFLYWNRVALAGDVVDRRVNRDVLFGGPFLPGGGANPAFGFNDTDFWVQTIDIGLTLDY